MKINDGIMINVYVSVKIVMYVNSIFRIQLYVIVKMENIQQVLTDDSAIVCDEVIDADALFVMKLQKSNDAKLSLKDNKTNLKKKKVTFKMQNFYILFAFLLTAMA